MTFAALKKRFENESGPEVIREVGKFLDRYKDEYERF
jgi:hypothetical protein